MNFEKWFARQTGNREVKKKNLTRRVDFHLADILHIIIVYDAPNSFICFNYLNLLQFVFNFALQIIFSWA